MSRHLTASGLFGYATAPILKQVRNWWLCRLENHYLMCADTEEKRVKEAQQNVAHYQKQAALARSARI